MLRLVHTCLHFQVPNEAPSSAWLANFYQNDFYRCRGGTSSSRRKCGAKGQWGSGDDDSEEEEEAVRRAEQDSSEEEAAIELQRWEDMCAGAKCASALKHLRAERVVLLDMQAAEAGSGSDGGSGGGGGGGRSDTEGKARSCSHRDYSVDGRDDDNNNDDGSNKRRRRLSASDIYTAAAVPIPAAAVRIKSLSNPLPAALSSCGAPDIVLGSSQQQLGGCHSPMVIGEEAGGEEAAAAEKEAATQEAAAAGEDPCGSVDIRGEGSISDRLRINLDAQIDAIVLCMEAVHLSRRPLIQKVCRQAVQLHVPLPAAVPVIAVR